MLDNFKVIVEKITYYFYGFIIQIGIKFYGDCVVVVRPQDRKIPTQEIIKAVCKEIEEKTNFLILQIIFMEM